MLKPADLYAVTNSGLDIIQLYFPEAEPGKAFKMRDENTPSARVKLYGEVYKATDFGGDGHAISPLDIVMQEERITFSEALYKMAARFDLAPEINAAKNIPGIKQRDPLPDEKDGQYDYELNETFTDDELKLIGPNVTQEHCNKLNYHSCKWYSVVKKAHKDKNNKNVLRKVTIISSNENYPIFLRDCGEFKKVYQPLNPDKGFRFFYIGTKPKEYINGLAELKRAYQEYNDYQEADFAKDELNKGTTWKPVKYPEAIICSGERDALNCASFGYQPLWFNSETYNLSEKEYKEIAHYAEKIYNIPDIDQTGRRKAHELALKFIDIYTVQLPLKILNYIDSRKKPRKDLRDFVELYPDIKHFKDLLNVACPARFWQYKAQQFGMRLEINSEYLTQFLTINGFCTMPYAASKAEQILIQVKDNIIYQTDTRKIRNFIKNWLRERYFSNDILNLVNNSKRVGDSNLEGLPEYSPDFNDAGSTYQYLFFDNTAVKITAEEIKAERYNSVNKSVWQPLIIKNDFRRSTPAFSTAFNDEKRRYDITVCDKSSKFFKFLINASRIHWRAELETSLGTLQSDEADKYRQENKFEINGPNLTAFEQEEQRMHLLNKIFAIGYLLHSWKASHRAWMPFVMDNKISDEGHSNGRSGKSFCFCSLEKFKTTAYIAGRNEKIQDNKFLFEEVTELTRLMIINDAHKYFPFSMFFDSITEKLTVNPKFGKQFTLPFEKAPKIVAITNFASRNIEDSTQARLLYCVFGDYYHEKTENNDYQQTRKIYDDFGKQLQREDYTPDEWNADFNFYADCLSFYISTIPANRKVSPPMDNVKKRNLREGIGDAFKTWADGYFHLLSDKLNTSIPRSEAQEAYLKLNKHDSPQKFSSRLEMWCKYTPWVAELNPKELHTGKSGRIITKEHGEMIHIRTHELNQFLPAAGTDITAEPTTINPATGEPF